MIPCIVHQTWKDAMIPERFRTWHASWRRMNPGFSFRLWTDADISKFVAAEYPEWVPIIRAYRTPISRVDLARYLILHRYGGVYADLDAECLQPFAPLLEGQSFIIGTEPVSHEREEKVVRSGLHGLLCPTVIASVPGHPFWEHLFGHLRAAAHEPDALDATGPFLLTRAHMDYRGPPVTIVPPEVFYPLDKWQCRDQTFESRDAWPPESRRAYAVHYWEGTWWRPEHLRNGTSGPDRAAVGEHNGPRPTRRGPSPPRVRVVLGGHLSAASGLGTAARGTAAALTAAGIPVTALDISEGPGMRLPFDPGIPEEAAQRRAPGAAPVHLLHTNPDALLTALSNRDPAAARLVAGARFRVGYWAWEGLEGIPANWSRAFHLVDEIWVPSQFTARAVAAHVPMPVVPMGHPVVAPPGRHSRAALGLPEDCFCFLTVFDALSNLDRKNPAGLIRAYVSAFPQATAKVMLIVKARNLDEDGAQELARAAEGRRDIAFISDTLEPQALGSLMATCDAYVSLHRTEGFGLTVAEAMALGRPVIATGHSATTEFMIPGTGYAVPFRMVTLQRRNGYYPPGTRWADPDIDKAAILMRHLVARPDEGRSTGARAADHVRRTLSPEAIGRRMSARLALLESRGKLSNPGPVVRGGRAPGVGSGPAAAEREQSGVSPRVLVLTPMKNTSEHLDRYVRLLESLDYPRDRLGLCVLEGDSTDDTWNRLTALRPRLEARFTRVDLRRHDQGFRLQGPRWAPGVQRARRGVIAKARNRLLSFGLGDEDWVLWLDADLLHYPQDLLRKLLGAGKDIVVPHCAAEEGGTFDRNTFAFSPDRQASERPEYLRDGLFQPPPGRGRIYLDAFRGQSLVPVDSVGGTALLVRADLHRDGLVFPSWPHRGYIETEGLAMVAKELGITCWGMPDLEIVHVRG